jgi:uncharacterized protein (DUF362 family)/Pyruvate/2-oxoacid:ferredoxin oxidoreductase delta subunit
MNDEKVYLKQCDEYDLVVIERILGDALDYLDITLPGSSRILLKPNILGIYPPERHITTHPVMVEAMVRLLLDHNNSIILGDSSGNGQYGYTTKALAKSGMTTLGEKYGFPVVAFDKYKSRVYRNNKNRVFKTINLTSYIDEVDYIINLPKLKSHTFLSYTGAVKNFYGCIPGAGKPFGHIRAPGAEAFSQGLIDIYLFVKPKILVHIMDGITGIEGHGPGTGGKIKKTGFIGVSSCAFALDAAILEVIGAGHSHILTQRYGKERKLFSGMIKKNSELPPVHFDLPKPSALQAILNRFIPGFALSKPYSVKEQCTRCGFCAQACPAGAITLDEYPLFNYKKCIYCFCCHENCPEGAIHLKENFLFRLFTSHSGDR